MNINLKASVYSKDVAKTEGEAKDCRHPGLEEDWKRRSCQWSEADSGLPVWRLSWIRPPKCWAWADKEKQSGRRMKAGSDLRKMTVDQFDISIRPFSPWHLCEWQYHNVHKLCVSVISAGLSSAASVPQPRPRVTGGGDFRSRETRRARKDMGVADTWHLAYTSAARQCCAAVPPCGARRGWVACLYCLHHLLSGHTQDEG